MNAFPHHSNVDGDVAVGALVHLPSPIFAACTADKYPVLGKRSKSYGFTP